MKADFNAEDRWEYIPRPVSDKNEEFNALYLKTWEIVSKHVRSIAGMPQSPYMDEGFCNTQVWIWDTCFMSLFCKYAQSVFPGKESLKNFYAVFYGGKRLPFVIPTENEPKWTGAVPGKKFRIQINIADNPPLFAWAEYENALFHGDKRYVKTLLYKKQYLQRHYEWLENLTKPVLLDGFSVPTCWIKRKYGYKWEGGRSGMDNTPRGRVGETADKERPNNPDMLWVDAICQQALSAKCISLLFVAVGDKENAALWDKKYRAKKAVVNKYYWDKKDGFYYDIDDNTHDFYKVKTLASYWALTAGLADEKQAEKMAEYVSDPANFGGEVPLTSLARSDNDFDPSGRYWRGSLWLPLAYAALKGLVNYGYYDLARSTAIKILEQMSQTYYAFEPHTVWECYSPTEHKPATQANGKSGVRKDFCGWSALGPISIYIEFVLGFYEINAFEKIVKWAKPDYTDGKKIGIKNLHFGDVVTDIIAKNNKIVVNSNKEYVLLINGKTYLVKSGENVIDLS